MAGLDSLEAVFGKQEKIAYDNQTVGKIRSNRKSLDGELFVNKLMKALGIQDFHKLYPPQSHNALQQLHQHIVSSASPDHQKHSVLYYILKDVSNKATLTSKKFAKLAYLPEKYQTFIDGIWLMDNLRFEKALYHLTEPSLTPTFSEDILFALCKRAPEDNGTLAISYYQAVSPPLTSKRVITAYFTVLCTVSITEAFYFSRAKEDAIRRELFEKLVASVLGGKAGEAKASQGVELITLPLDNTEETWFRDYLKDGRGDDLSGLKGAADSLIMRDIVLGRKSSMPSYVNSAYSGKKIHGVNWDSLTKAIRDNTS